jgi:hypothetical protein
MQSLFLSSRSIFLAGMVFWRPLSRFSGVQNAVSLNSLPRMTMLAAPLMPAFSAISDAGR